MWLFITQGACDDSSLSRIGGENARPQQALDQKRNGWPDEHATGRFVATAIRADSSISHALSCYNRGAESATRRPVRNLPQDKAAYLSHHVSLLAQYFRRWLWAGSRCGHRHYL